MNYLYISQSHDPYLNVAIEKNLFDGFQDGMIIYFWINSPCIVIGRNQNPYKEINLEKAHEKGIKIVRRFSGGGAVYQDLGNLNYTIISRKNNLEEVLKIITDPLRQLGFATELSGRNDVMLEGKKVSGIAYLEDNGRFMYHGTLLIDTDLSLLEEVLTPSKLKIESKGISSVRERVKNLREKNKDFSSDSLIEAVKNNYLDLKDYKYNKEEVEKCHKIISSKEWIYGESPEFNIELNKIINGRETEIRLFVKNGLIEKAVIFSDSLDVSFSSKLSKNLIGKLFSEENVQREIEKL
ncbi:MAG: lipoate--protein ligase [Bacillales bacterium]|nr:lipoate--protein ligase [Bacillales bacterium]